MHAYYTKNADLCVFQPTGHCSWILKAMFKLRDTLFQMAYWRAFQITGKYCIEVGILTIPYGWGPILVIFPSVVVFSPLIELLFVYGMYLASLVPFLS